MRDGETVEGNLSTTELKVIFEPMGVAGVQKLTKALSFDKRILSLEFGINTVAGELFAGIGVLFVPLASASTMHTHAHAHARTHEQ